MAMAMAMVAAAMAVAASRERRRMSLPMVRLDQLWWWLAVVSVVAIVGQEVARTSAAISPLEAGVVDSFDGFDELDEEELAAEAPIVVPPPVLRPPGFENDHGPPTSEADSSKTGEQAVAMEEAQPPVRARQDLWDEDEFEGVPVDVSSQANAAAAPDAAAPATKAGGRSTPAPVGPQNYYMEAFSVFFLVVYAIKYLQGKKENEKVALAWAAEYCSKGSIFDRNFSLLGTGEGAEAAILMKEGQNVFKFYASGRRFCEGLLATLDLKNRHDLIACLWNFIFPRKDELTIDVLMNDDSMDNVLMAVARRKNAKSMNKDWTDLQQFATVLSPPSNRRWVSEELSVISESREIASDLLTETVMELVFGDKSFEKYGSNFISLHFSDLYPMGSHKKLLQFRFYLPPVNRMSEISRLIQAVPYFIDAIGRYRLSSQARGKADAGRKKMAQEAFKEAHNARQEALARRKEEQDSKLSPEALRKKEEKDRMKQMKKSMPRMRVSRAH